VRAQGHRSSGHDRGRRPCEAASRALSRAYLASYGRILHHNLDKGLLVAGRSRPRFGGGEMLEPMKLVLCGRATSAGPEVSVRDVVATAARDYLARRLRGDPGRFDIVVEVRDGAANLQEVFARGVATPLANDTSFGCGHAPLSRLEKSVLAVAQLMTSDEFQRAFPAAGEDFKIMGARRRQAFSFTLALAFVDRHVEDVAHYFAIKRDIGEYLAPRLPPGTVLRLNTLDDPAARTEAGIYLTVTGLSAEMGDDGQAGRGNRVNGLITPGRPMSLEAAAGKNPVAHIGKLYNVLAMLIARDIHAHIGGVEEVGVQLLANIGRPVSEPEIAAVEVAVGGGLTAPRRREIAALVERALGDLDRVTRAILDEEVTLF
jgi:S-adenosylmethionine synthetase